MAECQLFSYIALKKSPALVDLFNISLSFKKQDSKHLFFLYMGQFFIANQYTYCPPCDFELYLVRNFFLSLGTKSRDENCPLYRKIWVWTKAEHKKTDWGIQKGFLAAFFGAFGKRGCPSLLWPSLGPDGPREGHSSSGHPLLPQSPKKCLEDFLSSLSYFLCSTLVQIHTRSKQ